MKMEQLTKIEMYTDGACSGNPGPGGWGTILKCGEKVKELSGGEASTTNNRMELTAVIAGLSALKRPCRVVVTSDSKYIIDAIEKGWAKKWKANGWMRNKKDPALNPDLWDKLLALLEIHEVSFCWVKGHAGHPENERCDEMAVAQSKRF
jgi:ribonuclease HI